MFWGYYRHFSSELYVSQSYFNSYPITEWADNIIRKSYVAKHCPIDINNRFNSRKRSFTKNYLTQTFSNVRKNRRKHRYDRFQSR